MSPESRIYHHYTVEPVAIGVYACIATVEGGAGCNAGIVDLGQQTLVFDTCANLAAARELRTIAEAVTGRPATYVINSHMHPDHINGNRIFADDATIVASAKTRAAIASDGVQGMERMRSSMAAEGEMLHRRLGRAEADEEKAKLRVLVKAYDEFLVDYPTAADLRLPTLTYEGELTFFGSQHTARLIALGAAHSPCDAVLWLPEVRVLFTADLVVANGSPVIGSGGDATSWPAHLEQLDRLGARILVPGHGACSEPNQCLSEMQRYLAAVAQCAEEAMTAGASAEYADAVQVPAGYGPGRFRQNVRQYIQQRMACV